MSARLPLPELRAIAQPPAVMSRRNAEHWAGALYLRKMSIYLTYLLVPTGISANGVTAIMIGTGLAGAAVLMWPSPWAVLLCAVVMQLQILIDCSDGEVARVRRKLSPAGVYLDRIGHYTTEAALPIGLGVHLDGGPGSIGGYTTLGALTGVVVLVNKAFGDLIHFARAHAGLPLLPDTKEAAQIRAGTIATLRGVLKFAPIFRAFISIEFSLLLLLLTVIDELTGADSLRWWGIVMLPVCLVLAAGRLLAVLRSDRLSLPAP